MFKFGSLEENVAALEQLDRSNKNLAAKLAIAEKSRAHEMSIQFLLNFELAQIKKQLNEANQDVEGLEAEQKRLIETNKDLALQVKLIRNYFGYVNMLQADRKAEYLQNLRGELNSLDFTLEARNNEPNKSVEKFTQVPRRG